MAKYVSFDANNLNHNLDSSIPNYVQNTLNKLKTSTGNNPHPYTVKLALYNEIHPNPWVRIFGFYYDGELTRDYRQIPLDWISPSSWNKYNSGVGNNWSEDFFQHFDEYTDRNLMSKIMTKMVCVYAPWGTGGAAGLRVFYPKVTEADGATTYTKKASC